MLLTVLVLPDSAMNWFSAAREDWKIKETADEPSDALEFTEAALEERVSAAAVAQVPIERPALFTAAWIQELERATVAAVNLTRAQSGVESTEIVPEIMQAARRHSEWMAEMGLLLHDQDVCGGPVNAACGENILKVPVGNTTWRWLGIPLTHESVGDPNDLAIEAAKVWFDSPGHQKNMLDPQFVVTGVGVAVTDAPSDHDGQTIYFTQKFRSR